MKLFDLFKTKRKNEATINEADVESIDWEALPPYLPADQEEHELVSVIVSAIAARDHLEARFTIKKILKRNPEFELVSLASTASMVRDDAKNHFKIKNIMKRKEV